MIGIPPTAGMVSKWYLATGALEAGYAPVLLVLVMSSALNAAYFLPLLYRIWWLPAAPWPEERQLSRHFETHWMLLFPAVLTAVLILLMGILAGTDISPLTWAELIVEREFSYDD